MISKLLLAAGMTASLAACAGGMGMDGGGSSQSDMSQSGMGQSNMGQSNMGQSGMGQSDMTPTGRTGYVQMAAASDMFEIESSNLARSRAQNPQIRQFAEMMVMHHTKTTADLTAAASASGVMPRPMLMPMQQQMLSQLQGASASGFDKMYMTQQVKAHQMALALHSGYAQNGDTPALRTVAMAATPIVQEHLTRAQQLD